jgi:transposase
MKRLTTARILSAYKRAQALVNAARGLVKSFGERLPRCGTYQVNEKLAEGVSAELRDVLVPLLREDSTLHLRVVCTIKQYAHTQARTVGLPISPAASPQPTNK